MIFGRNDLVQDAPISRIDLLVCRNTLMYFNAETQARILRPLPLRAATTRGFLFLGKAEMLITHRDAVRAGRPQAPHVPQGRQRRRSATGCASVIRPRGRTRRRRRRDVSTARQPRSTPAPRRRSWSTRDGRLALANRAARDAVRARRRPTSAGRCRTSSSPTGRSSCAAASSGAAPSAAAIALASVAWRRDRRASRARLDVAVAPLLGRRRAARRQRSSSPTSRAPQRLQRRARALQRELETAYEELQSTNEELETTNEELQSTNEELETTNEELQSTNEELETMNEELQSTNEELQTINDELRSARASSTRSTRSWRRSSPAWAGGRRCSTAPCASRSGTARPRTCGACAPTRRAASTSSASTSGCRSTQLRATIRDALRGATGAQVTLEATNRRGRPIECTVTALPLIVGADDVSGVILLMEQRGGGAA